MFKKYPELNFDRINFELVNLSIYELKDSIYL